MLLHGTPLSPEIWAPVASRLGPADAVSCPDLNVAVEGDDLPAALAAHLAAQVDRVAGPVHVAGHSFGGQVAIDLALAAPDLVRSLTIVCSRDTPYPAFAAAAADLRGAGPVNVEEAMSRWFRPSELEAGGPGVSYARHQLQHADRLGWARALDAIATYDRSAVVSSIRIPVRLIAAQFDAVSTPAVMDELAGRLPLARLHVLTDAAHLSPFLNPDVLATLIRGDAG